MKEAQELQSQIESLERQIDSHQVGMVEVFNIPSGILTRTRITPEMLERQYNYKLTIRDLRGDRMAEPLAHAIKSTRLQATTTSSEVRLGVVFYGTDGARIVGVYFDLTGRQGFIGNTPASIRGDLFNWLKTNFPASF